MNQNIDSTDDDSMAFRPNANVSYENHAGDLHGTDVKRRALYLNKFGIMHTGLVEVVREMARAPDVDEIVLGICSSQFSDRNKSPEKDWIYNCLDAKERQAVMSASLHDISKPIIYVQIPDQFPIDKSMPDNKWIDNLVMKLIPDFDILYSDRDTERICIGKKGKEIRDVPKRVFFSDHCIRDKIARGEVWQPYFVPEAAALLKNLGVEKRYNALFQNLDTPEWVKGMEIDYEWRTFDIPPNDMAKIWPNWQDCCPHPVEDHYVLSLTRTSVNMKTQKQLKIKQLLRTTDTEAGSIEEWVTQRFDYPMPREKYLEFAKKARFPIKPGLPDMLFGTFFAEELTTLDEELTFDFPNPYLMRVCVGKERYMRTYDLPTNRRVGFELVVGMPNLLSAEGADPFLLRNPQLNAQGSTEEYLKNYPHTSIAIEAATLEDAVNAVKHFGLTGYRQMNYIQFLERSLVNHYKDEIFGNMMLEGA